MMNPTASNIIKVTSIAISIVGIIANALVCHIIVRLKTMKTSINYIILNLAILDAIYGFLSINLVISKDNTGALGKPVLPQAYNRSALLAEVLCKVEWCYWISSTVPPVLLMAMAYERYKAIVHPFSTLNSSVIKVRIKCLIAFAWISGLAYLVIDIVVVQYDNKTAVCALKNYSWFDYRAYFMVFLITQHLFPSIAMLVFYARVICAIRKQDNALGPQAEVESARRKSRKKVMWIVIVVTVVFYICCGIPQTVYILYQLLSDVFLDTHLIIDILVVLLSCNSAFNPFAYFLFIKSFRDGFNRVFIPRKNNSNTIFNLGNSQTSIRLENLKESGQKKGNTGQPKLLSFVNQTSK